MVSKVSKVEHHNAEECEGAKYYYSGQSEHIQYPDSCRTNFTIFFCKTPFFKEPETVKVEILG